MNNEKTNIDPMDSLSLSHIQYTNHKGISRTGHPKNKMNHFRKVSVFLFLLSLTFILAGCSQAPEPEEVPPSGENTPYIFLNSVLDMNILDDDKDVQAIKADIFERVQHLEELMTMRSETSEVSMINAAAGIEPVQVSDETFEVIKASLYYSEISEGNFDISVGPLVQLWGIGTDSPRVPEQQEIDQALSYIDYRDIILDEEAQTVMLAREGMMIDLGAIAKGYVADKITDLLIENDVESAIINLGGNVYIHGDKDGADFRIGIQNPFDTRGDFIGIYQGSDKSVVTSGAYERFFEQGGKSYHHILSTETGYPVDNEIASTTIISARSIDGDALSTSVFALGADEGIKLIESLEDVDAIFITKDKEIYLTKNLKDRFTLTDTEYTMAN